MLHCVDRKTVTDVSRNIIAFIFRVKQTNFKVNEAKFMVKQATFRVNEAKFRVK